MDEPSGPSTGSSGTRCPWEIKRIQRTLGLTVLYVTHDQEEALILSDRIAIMHEGRLHQVGPPAEVYERPATGFVADFVGESNVLAGVVEKTAPQGLAVRLSPSGRLLWARTEALAPGQTVRLMVRPEAMAVGITDPDEGDNRVEAVVEDALYLGQAIRYVVRADDLTLVARVPRKPGDVGLRAGTRVTVSWAARATAVIPESAS